MDNLATRWLHIVRQLAETDEGFRFAALIGSYARQETPADDWSDLDLVTAFDDPDRMFADTSWLEAFGEPKIVFAQGLPAFGGRECRAIFADGAMLDMVIFATKDFATALYDQEMRKICHRGYQILVDKDGFASSPDFDPDQPIPEESVEEMSRRFVNSVNCFWFHVIWTRKKLRRGEIMQAKGCLDRFMKDLLFDILRMKARLTGGPGSDTWHEARFFERWVAEDDQRELTLTYAHYDVPDIEEALERTMDLFARVAREVAALLPASYPEESEHFARTTEEITGKQVPDQRHEIIRPFREMNAKEMYACREETTLRPVIRSMYLCVRDMERAIQFYRRFLEANPIEKDEIFSVFDVGGFRLGLFAYGKMGEAHTFGDNCLPSIEVESQERFLAKLQTVEVVYGPKPIGCFLVAEFLDSEGNRIELTTRKESAG